MSKLLKVTLEFEDKILVVENEMAEKWKEHCDAVAMLAYNYSMNPFDYDPIEWRVISKVINTYYMPPLPKNRKYNHFNIGDKVVVYIRRYWYTGEVKNGYRHYDGCISYKLDGIGPQNEGEYWGCGFSTPCVMLKSEYDWFVLNPDKYKIWRDKSCARSYNGETIELPEVLI